MKKSQSLESWWDRSVEKSRKHIPGSTPTTIMSVWCCVGNNNNLLVLSCSRVINWGVVCPIDLCLVEIAIYVYHHHHSRPCFSVQVHGARALRTTGTCVLHHDLRQVEEGWRWNVAAPLGGGKLLWALLKVPETH